MTPRSPNPETEALERAARSQRPAREQDHDPKRPPRPDTGNKTPAGAQGARPRDGL